MAKRTKSDSAHIAIYLPSLRGGGAERVMVTVANGLARRGHRVDLVLARAEGPFLSTVAESVRIVDFKRGRVLSSLVPLVRYMRSERPTAVLSALTHANIVAIVARRVSNIKTRLVISQRNVTTKILPENWSTRIIRMLIGRLYPSADSVVCVSRGIEKEMIEAFGLSQSKVTTIYNPLDFEQIEKLKGIPLRHPWLLSSRKVPVILAVGRLTVQKDYPTLLNAFSLLRERRPCRLVVLGEGEDRSPLLALASKLGISEDVEFPGFQDNPFAWMASCDLFVMSSKWEGLPGALLQAMACGARVISTDCRTGPSEILEDGKWGGLVPVGSPEALALGMAKALDDPSPVDVLCRANHFHLDEVLNSYEDVLIGSP